MKISRFLYALSGGMLLLASCAKEKSESFDKYEDQALEAWMTQNRPDLLENFQSNDSGGYYIDVLSVGNTDLGPINDTICWVKFDFSGRDLSGNIVLTRSASDAKLAGTFTKYTHYVPYYRYCGEENAGLMEGTWLAMRNKQLLGETYFNDKNEAGLGLTSREFLLRPGSKVRLYMPSRVVSSSGVEGDGGYEGQYSLSTRRPFIVTMEICDTIKNPLQREGIDVDDFCADNGSVQVFSKEDEDASDVGIPIPTDPDDAKHPYNDMSHEWFSASDSIPQLYVNYRYTPDDKEFTFANPYHVGYEPYATAGSVAALDEKISAALKKRFHEDADVDLYTSVKALDADSVKTDGTAKIWYIGRFLDGFIFDTNIDEVKQIIYGEVASAGSAFSYTPSEGGMIQAFYYVVPNLKFGQWAALITTSTNAYGSSGITGSSSSSSSSSGYSSSYYDYLNYMNYANSYYGSSYGGYYGGYYGSSYGGYYNPYYGSSYNYGYGYGDSSSVTTETTTTISTEVPPFTPLLFQFYIEPADE